MFKLFRLILPILFPSWRFFSSIGPSPRVEVGFVTDANASPTDWLSIFPQPEKLSFASSLVRLLHNPQWNERLYINTCAEHLFESHSEFHEQQIAQRLLSAVKSGEIIAPEAAQYLIFRIRTLVSEHEKLTENFVFISRSFSLLPYGVKK